MVKLLAQKRCFPCEGGYEPLNKDETNSYLSQIKNWDVNTACTSICREFVFKDFVHAMDFVNKVAQIAEDEGHHPDIHLTNYKQVRIDLTTHAIKGLSENDFILAAKIDLLV